MFITVNEFKNDTEYLYAYAISFLLGIRLLTITVSCTPLYVASQCYIFSLIILYCIADRRHMMFTIFLVFHLISACMYLNSNFLMMIIIILTCLPLALTNEDKKFSCNVIVLLVPIIGIFFIQLYGFKNVITYLYIFGEHLEATFKFDMFAFAQDLVHGNYLDEFQIISRVFEIATKYFNYEFRI